MLETQEKEAPQGNILEIFLLNTLKNYILNGKFNPKMGTIRAFFFQNRDNFTFLGRLNMSESGWILLNSAESAKKCLNKLFWLCHGFQYTAI